MNPNARDQLIFNYWMALPLSMSHTCATISQRCSILYARLDITIMIIWFQRINLLNQHSFKYRYRPLCGKRLLSTARLTGLTCLPIPVLKDKTYANEPSIQASVDLFNNRSEATHLVAWHRKKRPYRVIDQFHYWSRVAVQFIRTESDWEWSSVMHCSSISSNDGSIFSSHTWLHRWANSISSTWAVEIDLQISKLNYGTSPDRTVRCCEPALENLTESSPRWRSR